METVSEALLGPARPARWEGLGTVAAVDTAEAQINGRGSWT